MKSNNGDQGGFYMKRQINTLYVDLYRAFGSIEFLTAVFGVCIVYYIGAWSEIKFASDILYLFRYSSTSSTFYLLLVFVSVLPYATCFCSDWNSEFIKPAMIRSGTILGLIIFITNIYYKKSVGAAVSFISPINNSYIIIFQH